MARVSQARISRTPSFKVQANSLADRMLRGLMFEKKHGSMRPVSQYRTLAHQLLQRAEQMLRRFVGVYGVSYADLVGRPRTQSVRIVRMAAIYWIRRRLGIGLIPLGRLFGRDHATILHSIRHYPLRRAAAGRYVRTLADGLALKIVPLEEKR
jgi:hypothetical protein